MFQRIIFPQLLDQVHTKEIVVLTGMRRVGKTTVYRMIFDRIQSSNKIFLDLENPLEQKIFEETDYNAIWSNLASYGVNSKDKAYIFLDEIQERPEIVKAVKYLYDHYDVKFFLTGSSSYYFTHLFPESLAGRKILFELYPLTFQEFLIFKQVQKSFPQTFEEKAAQKNGVSYEKYRALYDEYLAYGGFPEVVLAPAIDQKCAKLNDIFTSYFEKDVAHLADIRNVHVFRDLLLLLLQRTGSKLDVTRLASEVGVSRPTVYHYLSFLESTYVIFFVSQYGKNVDGVVRGGKKLYVCDNGFLSVFSRVPEATVLENAVYLNVRSHGKVQFFQAPSGAEVDFILPEKSLALEVKWSAREKDVRDVTRRMRSSDIREYYVVSKLYADISGAIPAQDL
jgi:predicted AAA+ superfamily ATPase